MSDTIEFNTGRYYAPEGQIIQAEIIESEGDTHQVRFTDRTRRVYGVVTIEGGLTQGKIMAQYDAGNYRGISSFELGGM